MSVLITTTPANQANKLGIFTFGDIAGASALIFHQAASVTGIEANSDTVITSISAPNLVSIDPTNLQLGSVFSSGCTSLASLSFPALQTVGGDMVVLSDSVAFTNAAFPSLATVGHNLSIGGAHFLYNGTNFPALTQVGHLEATGAGTFSFPALTTIGGLPGDGTLSSPGTFKGTTLSMPVLVSVLGNIVFNSSTLTTINLPVWLPTPGKSISFFGCNALTAASVNHVLARCVANAAFTTGTVILPGAAPTGQGITDKSTLISRGVSVTTT